MPGCYPSISNDGITAKQGVIPKADLLPLTQQLSRYGYGGPLYLSIPSVIYTRHEGERAIRLYAGVLMASNRRHLRQATTRL